MFSHATNPTIAKPAALIIQRKCHCGGRSPALPAEKTDLESSPYLQAKLRIGPAGDKYEREADRVADQLMRMPEPIVQQQPIEGEQEEEVLRTKVFQGVHAPVVTRQTQAHITAVRGGGSPLPSPERSFFEPRFGIDFSHVRIHGDRQAVESARSIGARAFTIGRDIFMGEGHWPDGSREERHLVAHELVHTIQQNPKWNAQTGSVGYLHDPCPYDVHLARGTPTGATRNIRGMEFDTDDEGNLIITTAIIRKTIKDTYNEHLSSEDQWSGPEHVKDVMSKLDTFFYYLSRDSVYKDKTFVVDLDPLSWGYSAEEINYLGVGLGFNHFHIFGHFFPVAQAMVAAWNLTEYGHLASFGEHYWADVGFDLYYGAI